MEVAFAWQSGHRPNQRGTSHGTDGAFPDSLQPALLRVYRWTSDQWHQFLDLENSISSRGPTRFPPKLTDRNCAFVTQVFKRKVSPTHNEAVDKPQKRRFSWSRPIELSQSRFSEPNGSRGVVDKVFLRESCAASLRYLRTLPTTDLSTVRELHIEKNLLMADDGDNRSFVDELWTHLEKNITPQTVSIIVPDDMIASARKDQGQYEWFMWKLHDHYAKALLEGQLDQLRFVHNGQHKDEGVDIYEWFNVEHYIEKLLMPNNKALLEIRSTYWGRA